MAERRKPVNRTATKPADKMSAPETLGPESLSRRERRERAAQRVEQEGAMKLFEAGRDAEGLRELKVGDALVLAVESSPLFVVLGATKIVGENDRIWKLEHGITLLKDGLRSPNPATKVQTYLSAHPDSLTGRYLQAEWEVQRAANDALTAAAVLAAYAPIAGSVQEHANEEAAHLQEIAAKLQEGFDAAYQLADELREAVEK